MDFGLPLNTVYTVVCALAIVIGAFLLCAWLLKRGGPRRSADVARRRCERAWPCAARTRGSLRNLLHVGNKLVLITMSPSGAETLTEVTDPVEVDRIVGLCQQSHPAQHNQGV